MPGRFLPTDSAEEPILKTGNADRAGGIWLDASTVVDGGITNSGTINSAGNAAFVLATGGRINDGIINLGTGLIESSVIPIRLLADAKIYGGIENSGIIRGTSASAVGPIFAANNSAIFGGIDNKVGALMETTTSAGVAISLSATSSLTGTLNNAGTVRGGSGSTGRGISVASLANMFDGGIVNSGMISAGGNALELSNSANPFSVTNTGTISGAAVLGINTLNLNGTTARITGATTATGATGTVNVNGTFTSENTFDARTFNVNPGGTFVMNHNVTAGVGNFNNAGTLQVDAGKTVTLSGALVSSGAASINGSLTAGTTTVTGGRFSVNGSLTSNATVSGGVLGGVGTISGTISGAGTVNPGNSPGILTAAAVDPSAGTDFVFEFSGTAPNYGDASASVNDVLRLTDPTAPFTSALTAANTKTLFLNFIKDQLLLGAEGAITELAGGFFTDAASDFAALLNNETWNNAGFQVYVLGDGFGTDNALNGQGYYNWRNPAMFGWDQSLFLSTVPQTADFGSGDVNGQVMLLTVAVPEPSTLALGAAGLVSAAWLRHRRRRTCRPAGLSAL